MSLNRSRNNGHSLPQVVDLFSGAGGLSLGAARAGFAIRGSVENNPFAIDVHRRNFPSTIHIPFSVADITGKNLRERLGLNNGDLAGIIGGPPCQGFSEIGIRDWDDPRNELFQDFFRIVAEARPKFFLAENVPRIMDKENAGFLDRAFALVENDYHLITDLPINASEYGAPTLRNRAFFFGSLKRVDGRLTKNDFRPPSDVEKVVVKDALKGLPEKIEPARHRKTQCWRKVTDYEESYFGSRLNGHRPRGVGDPVAVSQLKRKNLVSGFVGTVHTPKVLERYRDTQPGKVEPISRAVRLDPDGFCPTLRAGTLRDHGAHQALRPIHPTEDRVITPREAARLQGFPDWFQFHPTKWHSFQQIGNSVSPIVAERLLKVVKRGLERG